MYYIFKNIFALLNICRVNIKLQFDIASEPANKIGIHASELHFLNFLNERFQSGQGSLHRLREIAKVSHFGAWFYRFNPFFDQMNELIGRMVSGGLFRKWLSENREENKLRSKIEDIGPEILTMDHMEVAFIASLLPLTLALTAFFVEIFVHCVKIVVPRIIVYFVLQTYYAHSRKI